MWGDIGSSEVAPANATLSDPGPFVTKPPEKLLWTEAPLQPLL